MWNMVAVDLLERPMPPRTPGPLFAVALRPQHARWAGSIDGMNQVTGDFHAA